MADEKAEFKVWDSETYSNVFQPIPGWTDRDGSRELIEIKGYKGDKSFTAELGFQNGDPFIRIWYAAEGLGVKNYLGRFDLNEEFLLNKLKG